MPSPVVDVLLPPQRNPAHPPQGFWGNAGNMAYEGLGLGDVAKALRGQMTPNEAQDFAFGAAMGLLPIGRGLKAAKGIRAYHGSPHDFDRFDISKIGTGEGAQAYGHGLYFAENPRVAQEYKQQLTDYADRTINGKVYDPGDPIHVAASAMRENNNDRGKAFLQIHNLLENYKHNMHPRHAGAYMEAMKLIRQDAQLPEVKLPGRMYEVNINAHPDQFLDWDKPLSKQAGDVQSAARPLVENQLRGVERLPWSPLEKNDLRQRLESGDLTGAELYRASFGHGPADQLREAGIPGIKYLDQSSRGPIPKSMQHVLRAQGEADIPRTSNYVVFDDKLIDIVRKYGLAALGLLPALAGGQSPQVQAQ